MNRADFRAEEARFKAALVARQFPTEEDQWLTLPATAICHTPGCRNEGKELVHANAPVNADGDYRLYCGACGQQQWDITLRHDDGPEHIVRPHEGLRSSR